MYLFRDNTFDAAIWQAGEKDYPTLPKTFAHGDVVLDIGCHIGSVADLAARRGATVVAYEANSANCELARFNLARHPSVTVHHAAVWRSDVDDPAPLVFIPSVDPANTGGGSVLFSAAADHWRARPSESSDPGPPEPPLASEVVPTVALDDVLLDLGRVRFLKIDAEGSEFPILLTAARLDLVDAIAGEYHELSAEHMSLLAPSARVGPPSYSAELLRQCLNDAGFATKFATYEHGRGFFSAERITAAPAR